MAGERTQQQVVPIKWGWRNVLPPKDKSREQAGKALREKQEAERLQPNPWGVGGGWGWAEREGSRL